MSNNDPQTQMIGELLRATFAVCDAHQVPRDSALAAAIYQTLEREGARAPAGPEQVIRAPAALGDAAGRQELTERIEQAVSGGARRLVLDFAGVGHVDGGALSAIVGAVKRARAAGAAVTVVNVGDEFQTVLDLTGLGGVMGGDGGGMARR